ncbi:MAG: DUF5615 family PIN-like protein [Nitrosomonas sp.]|nr:DUF5615 family PIN-like protein [Nitrosomonas sp.]
MLAVAESCRGESDRKVLSVCADEQRILITFVRDYGEFIYRERMPSSYLFTFYASYSD